MSDFFLALTQLMKEYTTADTANIFSIIESAATVVAAIGAIIAIIVTWKIACNQSKLMAEQTEIAKDQKAIAEQQKNYASEQIRISQVQAEISAVQADISSQQNKIALFGDRTLAYEKSRQLFDFLGTLDRDTYQQLKKSKSLDFFTYYISIRELNVPSVDHQKKKWEDLIQRQSELFRDDIYHLRKLKRLFPLSNEQKKFLIEIVKAYQELESAVCLLKSAKDTTEFVEEKFYRLQTLVKSNDCSDLDEKLLKYITFGEL